MEDIKKLLAEHNKLIAEQNLILRAGFVSLTTELMFISTTRPDAVTESCSSNHSDCRVLSKGQFESLMESYAS